MASTSSSASIPSHYKYDTFLSFRGEDTRFSFTDHLYEALCQAGITTFRDDNEILEGQELKPEIERAIRESKASVIVFSENFANSSWCLEEIQLILEQKRDRNHFVLPVFYKVDPSDVRNHRGGFEIEAKEGVAGSKWTVDNVNRWKEALREVANLKGMVVSGYETNFIAKIVDKIYCELDLKLLDVPTDLTGMETRAESINSWLENKEPGSPVLALCGMGGSGKTTLAKYLYNSNKQNFESSSFLEAIENQPDGLLGLKKQLLKDITGNNRMISNISEGTHQIEKAIQSKRALIIVDDIDDKDKLIALFGTNAFSTRSKIIITTRLLNIDTWFGCISSGCLVHKLELLNDDESLELLSCYAFGSKVPIEGFKELATQLVQYCEGNPLALKVLGSSLSFRSQDQWTRNNMVEIWRSRMNSLNSLKGDIDGKIQVVLQKSFESLPCESHKELFLHIACLFVGENTHLVEMSLENEWHAKSGIATLVNRCLLIDPRGGGRLAMHKLVQDMARKIVREESKDPAKRSRVWRHDDSYRLLSKGEGSETIEGLALDMLEVEQRTASKMFTTNSLRKMKNLKLLRLRYVKLTGSYKNFPDLILLSWHGCNLKTVPTGLLMSSLVAIDMSFGDLEKFEPPTVLNSVKLLDLACSYKLVSICSLYQLPKLESLLLLNCISLTHVCETIGDLENLSLLELSGCTNLWKASSIQKFVNQSTRPSLSLPRSLAGMVLNSNPFEFLPSYIDLKKIWYLQLSKCPDLKSLPCLPSTLRNLNVDWCTSLENITFESGRFALHEFSYYGCFRLCEIQGLFKLVPIAKLDEAAMGHWQWVKVYQDHKVDLIGDVITEGRTFNIQMLYEYGIRSIYLQGIMDERMATHEYTSSSAFLSFHVPLHPKTHRIQGLYITVLYRSSSSEERDTCSPLFAKISNITKGLTWVYKPVVFCKPEVSNDIVWLSYWPMENIFETGDEVHVHIRVDKRMIMVSACGASIVYTDHGQVEKEEKYERIKTEEVIGGDLSQFKVTEGGYYLCREDLFGSVTSDWLKSLFGDNISSTATDSRRWRVSRPSASLDQELNNFRNSERVKIKVELGMSLDGESEMNDIEKAIFGIVGVESVFTRKEVGRLTVVGRVDPQTVAMCVKDFVNLVQVLYVSYP